MSWSGTTPSQTYAFNSVMVIGLLSLYVSFSMIGSTLRGNPMVEVFKSKTFISLPNEQ